MDKIRRSIQHLPSFDQDDQAEKSLKLTYIEGLHGFEELRKHIKQGNEFCREVSAILQERAEAEMSYAKSISKCGSKLQKVTSNNLGTLAEAWSLAAVEMENEFETHKNLARNLMEELVKPLKNLADSQAKARKPIDASVDKAQKGFSDKKSDESKCKKVAFTCAKDREKLHDTVTNSRSGRGKTLSDKDVQKIEKSISKLDNQLRKVDKEYLDACLKTEASRQDWEYAVAKASSALQQMEEERISQMQDFMHKYQKFLDQMGPKLVDSCRKLNDVVMHIDTNADIRKVVEKKGTGPNQPEQVLPDYYAEDQHHQMDQERRRQLLQNYLIEIQSWLEKEQRGKEGVEKLVEVYQNRPNFADADAQDDARRRLTCVAANMSYLEASQYKISSAMAEVDNHPKPSSKYQNYIERSKDKQGLSISVLRLPQSMVSSTYSEHSGASYRPPADGGHTDPQYGARPNSLNNNRKKKTTSYYENTDDEVYDVIRQKAPSLKPRPETTYSMVLDDDEFEFDNTPSTPICRCKAIFDYVAQQRDELTIRPGDVITVYDQQEDGWWHGELSGRVGIFPATYVEQIDGARATAF